MPEHDESIASLVGRYLDRIAARTSTPGGGCVAAVNAAEAVSLLIMVARYSEGDEFEEMIIKLEDTRQALLKLADDDIQAFKKVMATWSNDGTAKKRKEFVDALVDAADVPKNILLYLDEIPEIVNFPKIVDSLARKGNKNLISDVAIAANLLISAFVACDLNILINLKQLPPKHTENYQSFLEESKNDQRRLREISDNIRSQL